MSNANTGKDPDEVVLRARGLRKSFGRDETAVTALDDITVDFGAGRLSAIMGPSGSGKSTFMHVLAGLDRVDSGQILMRGVKGNAEPVNAVDHLAGAAVIDRAQHGPPALADHRRGQP